MITDYYVCSASSPKKLEESVKAGIANGWQPLGGIVVNFWKGTLYQVMVKVSG